MLRAIMATQKHDPDTQPSHASADANHSTGDSEGPQGTRTQTAPDASNPDADRAAKPGQQDKAGSPQDDKTHDSNDDRKAGQDESAVRERGPEVDARGNDEDGRNS